jgi:hypothetical protein
MDAKAQVELVCEQNGPVFESVFSDSVRHYHVLHKDELLVVSGRSKAALINDYIYDGLRRKLGDQPGWEFIESRKGRFIGYNSQLLIRVKKLRKAGPNKSPCVNKTDAALTFHTQQNMDLLPHRAVNAYLGYVLNSESGTVDEIAFLCPNERGAIAWMVEVNGQAQRSIDFEIANPVPVKPDRIRVKRRKVQ